MMRSILILLALVPCNALAGEVIYIRPSAPPTAAPRDDSEVARLRAEVAELRAELAALRSEGQPIGERPSATPAVAAAHYPTSNHHVWERVRTNRRGRVVARWTMNREQLIEHLSQGDDHKDKFPRAWLEQLSEAQLQSLHADDHEDSVHWDDVEGAPRRPVRRAAVARPCPD